MREQVMHESFLSRNTQFEQKGAPSSASEIKFCAQCDLAHTRNRAKALQYRSSTSSYVAARAGCTDCENMDFRRLATKKHLCLVKAAQSWMIRDKSTIHILS